MGTKWQRTKLKGMECSLSAEVMNKRNDSINNPAGSPTVRVTYGLLRKWLNFGRWVSREIWVQDEQLTFQLLKEVNGLVFPKELG
jgi:hypothetical protein